MMLVSFTLQTKLIIGVGGNSKKAYEKAGSVSVKIMYFTAWWQKMQMAPDILYSWLILLF